jgi:hypothetical protein
MAGLCGPPAWAEEGPEPRPAEEPTPLPDDPTYLETPPFPGEPRDAVRLHFQSLFIPWADLGPGETTLYRPELRARVTLPVTDRAMLRMTALGGMGRYQFDGPDAFRYGGVSITGDSLDLYQTRLSAEGAWRVNEADSFLLREGESWALLGGLVGGSDFEAGAFDEGATGGVRLGVGYELPDHLRFAGSRRASAPPSTITWRACPPYPAT